MEDDDKAVETTSSPLRLRCQEIFLVMFLTLGIPLGIFSGVFVAMLWYLGIPIVCLLYRYLWLRLCRDPFLAPSDTFTRIFCEMFTTCPPDMQRTVPTMLFLLITILTISALGLSRLSADSVELNMFIVIFYNGFGTLLILVCAVWLVDILWLAWLFIVVGGGAAQNWWWKQSIDNSVDDSKSTQLDKERRLARFRAGFVFVLYVWWSTWALVAAHNPHILELSVPIPRLPPQCDGYRLGVAADLHAGALSGVKETQWMVDKLNELKPDAVALVGDIGDTSVNDALRAKLAPLQDLQAPDGAYLSFGNHEYLHNIEDYRKLFRTEATFANKVVLLENEHVVLNRNGDGEANDCSIMLIGMADWSGRTSSNPGQIAPDFEAALRSTPSSNGTTTTLESPPSSSLPMIMMQHQPANMVEAAQGGVGLQISGHTHGGQLWPQHILLGGYDAISGLHSFDVGSKDGPSYLFVSEGIVGWGPRLRFLCKTDLAVLTFRSPSLMEAEGLIPDTSITVATAAMYASFALVPLGVLLCLVPFVCLVLEWCRVRLSKENATSKEEEEEEDDDHQSTEERQGNGDEEV